MDLALDIRTAQNVPLALEPASPGERVLASVVDLLVMAAYAFVAVLVLGGLGLGESAVALVVTLALPLLLYHLAFEVLLEGRTPGKLALKTQVTRLDGAPPTAGQLALRWALRLVDVTLSMGGVALLSIAVTARAQRLGDLAAGTTVVRRRQRVRLGEVLYPPAPPDHTVQFPEAEHLSDADVRTIRAVLVRLRRSSRDARSTALARRAQAAVQARLGLDPVAMPPEPFLKAVVRDHTALLDRYGAPAGGPADSPARSTSAAAGP